MDIVGALQIRRIQNSGTSGILQHDVFSAYILFGEKIDFEGVL